MAKKVSGAQNKGLNLQWGFASSTSEKLGQIVLVPF